MKLKHNYKGKRGDISQPDYINYCFGKCFFTMNRLKKYDIIGGSIAKGKYARLIKHIRLDKNGKKRFTNKKLWWGRSTKYRLKKWNDNYRKNNKIN